MDWIVIAPQAAGAIIGFIQIFICFVIPSRENASSDEIECQAIQPVEEGTGMDIEATISMTQVTNSPSLG